MQLTTMQQTNGLSPVSWRFVWIGLALLLAAWPVAALSQDPSDPGDGLLFEEIDGQSGEAFGAVLRGGVLTGRGVGRNDTLTPIEVMPYFFLEEGMVFGDLRGFRSTEDNYGANVGFGYRHYVRQWDRIFGANFYYDYDNTSGQLFRQNGGGLETLGANWDMRLNTYFPVTQNTKEIDLSDPFNIRFNANNILFDQIRTFGVHLKGLDHELAVPLPGRYLERHNVKGVAGWYHFQQTGVKNTFGWKGRLEGDLTSNVHLGLEVTNDNTFDTNVVFTAAVSYGGFKQPLGQPRNQFDRMTAHVERFYNAVVQQVPFLEAGLVAQDVDGTPLFVEHVASNDPYDRSNIAFIRARAPQFDPEAPLGTFENPFLTIQQAQEDGPDGPPDLEDIIFVWANSVYDGVSADPVIGTAAIRTEGGVRLLGEADNAPHTFLINGQLALLPRAVNARDPDPTNPFDAAIPDQKPLFTNFDPGLDGVALVSGAVDANGFSRTTEFSGFRLGDELVPGSGPTNNGIVAPNTGDPVTNAVVNFADVNFAQNDGAFLDDVGAITFNATRLYGSGVNGLHVTNGTPNIKFTRDSATNLRASTAVTGRDEIQNNVTLNGNPIAPPTGSAVRIENTLAGSLVDLAPTLGTPARISYEGARAVTVTGNLGNARFGDITVNANFADPNAISNPGNAISITNSTGGYTFFQPISLTASLDDAIFLDNLMQGSRVTFRETVDIIDRGRDLVNPIITPTARGVFINNTMATVQFNNNLAIRRSLPNPTTPVAMRDALDIQGNTGAITFGGSVTIDGGLDRGIDIGSTTPNAAGSEIRFQQPVGIDMARPTTGESFVVDGNAGEVEFNNSASLTIGQGGGRGNTGILIEDTPTTGVVTFGGGVTIGNPLGDTNTAIVIRNTQGTVSFEQDTTIALAAAATTGGIAGVDINNIFAPVDFDSLIITSLQGTALDIFQAGNVDDLTNNGIVRTQGGVINAGNGAGIRAQESRIGLNFDAVSSTNSPTQGIFLDNVLAQPSRRTLQVIPDIGVDGSAITNSTLEGVRLNNAGSVLLASMSVTGSGTPANGLEGIIALNTPTPNPLLVGSISRGRPGDTVFTTSLDLNAVGVSGSAGVGVHTMDVPNVSIVNSNIANNGGPGDQQVLLEAQVDAGPPGAEVPYTFRITDTRVLQPNLSVTLPGGTRLAHAVEIRQTGNTPILNLVVNGDIDTAGQTNPQPPALITMNNTANNIIGAAALSVNWSSPANVTVQGYNFLQLRNFSDVIQLQLGAPDAAVTGLIDSNQITVGQVNDTAISGVFNGPTDLTITNNNIETLATADGFTGIELVFADSGVLTLGGTANIDEDFDVNGNPILSTLQGTNTAADPDVTAGNIINASNVPTVGRGVDVTWLSTGSAAIENNVIDIGDGNATVSGITLTAFGDTIGLNGGITNGVFLNGFQDSIPPWATFNPNGAFSGTISVNNVLVP